MNTMARFGPDADAAAFIKEINSFTLDLSKCAPAVVQIPSTSRMSARLLFQDFLLLQ